MDRVQTVRRSLGDILRVALRWICRAIPTDRRLWVFGSWFGERYADNPRALFDYVVVERPLVKAVWLTQNPSVVDAVRATGGRAVLADSPQGLWLAARAEWGFVGSGVRDLGRYVTPRRIMNLWHGIPLKTIQYEDPAFLQGVGERSRFERWYLKQINADLDTDICVSSDLEATLMAKSFHIRPEQIHLTGAPRMDVLYRAMSQARSSPNPSPFRVLYAPTHRRAGDGAMPWLAAEQLVELDRNLEAARVEMTIRYHFASPALVLDGLANIQVQSVGGVCRDLYEVLPSFDALITDYSSLFFDFIVMDRPVIFAAFDLEDYVAHDRKFNMPYERVIPGPRCESWDQVLVAIRAAQSGIDPYGPARRELARKFHPLPPGTSCERVCRTIDLLGRRRGSPKWR